MLLLARRWLPARQTLLVEFASGTDRRDTPDQRDVMIVEALVGQTSRHVQCPILDLDLASRYGIHLIAVHCGNASIAGIGDDLHLQFGDVLLVEGTPRPIQRIATTATCSR